MTLMAKGVQQGKARQARTQQAVKPAGLEAMMCKVEQQQGAIAVHPLQGTASQKQSRLHLPVGVVRQQQAVEVPQPQAVT
jgi:hypothetical protein